MGNEKWGIRCRRVSTGTVGERNEGETSPGRVARTVGEPVEPSGRVLRDIGALSRSITGKGCRFDMLSDQKCGEPSD